MKISLIIPAYNEERYIAACIDSVLRNASDAFFEILVIDNASEDSTATIARQYSEVRVVQEPRKGITYARQRGLTEARGDILAFIDAEVRLPNNWGDTLINRFENSSSTVALSGPYKYYDGHPVIRWIQDMVCRVVLPIGNWFFGYMLIGGNFAARKDALRAIGGFDLSINFYGEDTDIGRRLCAKGPVAYDNKFFVLTSTRRFYGQGVFKTNALYLLNFLSVALFKRPLSKKSIDFRCIPTSDAQVSEKSDLRCSFTDAFPR